MKNKYDKSVKNLFDNLGGYSNIESFYNCMTRMRFQLKDWDLAKEEQIKLDPFVIGVNKNERNGEYHVIIGPDVENYKLAFNKINGFDDQNKRIENKEVDDFKIKQENEIKSLKSRFHIKGSFNKVLGFISKVFSPIVIPLVGYGLILTLWSILSVDWNGANTNSSAAQNSHFIHEVVDILNILVSTFSLFITILVGYTTFKAMNLNGIYGIIIAIILTAPSLITMNNQEEIQSKISETQSILQVYPGWSLFGEGTTYPWKINYNGLIIPMIIVCLVGVGLEKLTNKIPNTTARMILAPLTIILGSFIFGVFIMAPIGLLLTNYLSIGINFISTNNIAKYIALPIVAGLYGPLVITGMHHSLTPIILQGQAVYGATLLQGTITISNITQGISSIAFVVLHRRVLKMRDLGLSNGVSAIIGGITEPSLYTINLKHLFPLIGASIGTFAGTFLLVASNSYAYQGASSIFGILMFVQSTDSLTNVTVSTLAGGGYLWGTLSIILSGIVGFTTTYFLGKTKFFWNKSQELILNDYAVDINELKTISKPEWKLILQTNKTEKQEQRKENRIQRKAIKTHKQEQRKENQTQKNRFKFKFKK